MNASALLTEFNPDNGVLHCLILIEIRARFCRDNKNRKRRVLICLHSKA